MSDKIKRYGVTTISRGGECWDEIVQNDHGNFVKYSDFIAAHTLAEQEITDLTASLKSAVDSLKAIAHDMGTDYCDGNTLIAHETLTELKSKHPDMFKGEV